MEVEYVAEKEATKWLVWLDIKLKGTLCVNSTQILLIDNLRGDIFTKGL